MEINWKEEFLKQKEYCIALEHTRADLMGLNEELREKTLSLEKGQEDLLYLIKNLKNILIGIKGPDSLLVPTKNMIDCIAGKYIEQKMKSGDNLDDGDASTSQDL